MATNTPRINLVKPDGTDLVDIAVINSNYDKIDANIASTKIQATKPATANAGDLWWDSNTGTLYLYYVDANSAQWVAATSDPVNIGVVANQSERDAQYPTPGQGMRVYRTDLGVTQTYYGLFNASTNPGGRDVAGWYDTEKSVGLVPIQPASAVIVTGTGSANAMGAVSFTGATSVSLNSVFNSTYKNYKILISVDSNSATTNLRLRTRNAGADALTGIYFQGGLVSRANGTGAFNIAATNDSGFYINYMLSGYPTTTEVLITSPHLNQITTVVSSGIGVESAQISVVEMGGMQSLAVVSDGFTFFTSAGTMTGAVQVFGYND